MKTTMVTDERCVLECWERSAIDELFSRVRLACRVGMPCFLSRLAPTARFSMHGKPLEQQNGGFQAFNLTTSTSYKVRWCLCERTDLLHYPTLVSNYSSVSKLIMTAECHPADLAFWRLHLPDWRP